MSGLSGWQCRPEAKPLGVIDGAKCAKTFRDWYAQVERCILGLPKYGYNGSPQARLRRQHCLHHSHHIRTGSLRQCLCSFDRIPDAFPVDSSPFANCDRSLTLQ